MHADAEHPFQLEKLAPAHGTAVLADFRPQRFRWHEEGSGKPVGGLHLVQLGGDIQNHVTDLVRDGKTLAFAPVSSVGTLPPCVNVSSCWGAYLASVGRLPSSLSLESAFEARPG